jgi:hypothetical protein
MVVQLLLAQAGDLHAQPTAATASASLIRMGIATRMVSSYPVVPLPSLSVVVKRSVHVGARSRTSPRIQSASANDPRSGLRRAQAARLGDLRHPG